MKFSELASCFNRLESTTSRNSMVEILAELFKKCSAQEIDKVVYLIQGRVAPLYEPIEFGVADKMVIRALAAGFGIGVDQVSKVYKKVGDLGTSVDTLINDVSIHRKCLPLTVSEVFEKLFEITQISKVGSVEKKITLLADLLSQSDPLSAKYITRIPVDKLRLGFSDMTILEGLSWMIDGTKKHKLAIEAAYNIRPDLGFIAKTVKEDSLSLSKIKNIKPKVGTPILVMRAERLTTAAEIIEKGQGTMAVEPKLDGLRTQLHFKRNSKLETRNSKQTKSSNLENSKLVSDFDIRNSNLVRLYSRGMENVTAMYPDLVAAAEKELKNVDEVILDGEAIGFDPKTGKYLHFQQTTQRKRKYDIDLFSKNIPLKLVVFDCLYANGESLIDKPYTQRRERVEKLLGSKAERKTIMAAEMQVVSSSDELTRVFEHTISSGLEGIMAKKLDGVYQAGARGWNWIKFKNSYTGSGLTDTIDAVVMGLDFGQGKRNKFGVGAFLVGVYDQKSDSYKTVSKVGTGLTDNEWRELKVKSQKLKVSKMPKNYDVNKVMTCDNWLKPKLVGEFLADEISKSPMHTAGYALRFPRLVQWREKKPEDTTSLKEILEMVKLQI